MRNDKPLKTRVLISSIILMFMILCDIYMIAMSGNFRLMAAAAFITFLWMTFTLDGWMSLREMGIREREEQYQDILKAEKASYLIFQQKFQDLDNKLNFIGQKIMPLEKANSAQQKMIASMMDSLREDQKKIAKVTINRSKENADALINSNGQLLRQMDLLIQSVPDAEGVGQPGGSMQQEIQALRSTQDAMMAKLQEISALLGSGAPFPPAIESQSPTPPQQPAGEELSPGELEALLSGMGKPLAQPEFQPLGAAAIGGQEGEEASKAMGAELEEPPAFQEQEPPEPKPAPKAVRTELEEPPAFQEQEPPELKPAPKASEPKPKPPAPKPKLADPNQMMSPEDIAALIANTEVEELPDTPQQPEEEKPPKPEVADPNKMMSPEEIAALIANM